MVTERMIGLPRLVAMLEQAASADYRRRLTIMNRFELIMGECRITDCRREHEEIMLDLAHDAACYPRPGILVEPGLIGDSDMLDRINAALGQLKV